MFDLLRTNARTVKNHGCHGLNAVALLPLGVDMPDLLGVLGSKIRCQTWMSCEERNFSWLEVLSWDTSMFQRSVVKLGEPKGNVQIGKWH